MAEVKPTTEIDIEESQVAEADETLAQTETVESDGDGEGGLTEQERAVRASALEEALRKDEEENESTVEKEKSQEEAPKTIVEEVEIGAVNVDIEKEIAQLQEAKMNQGIQKVVPVNFDSLIIPIL